ncbi:MAG: trigger factor family protein [Rhizomicrobium sp.]
MQITETVSEGLRREYKVVIAKGDLDSRLTGRLEEMKPRVNLKGFRPGKAPVSFLKKSFGKSLMGEIGRGPRSTSRARRPSATTR